MHHPAEAEHLKQLFITAGTGIEIQIAGIDAEIIILNSVYNQFFLCRRSLIPVTFQRPGDFRIPLVTGTLRIILRRKGQSDALIYVSLVKNFNSLE